MLIFEFISKYCTDLVQEHNTKKELLDLSEFPHDDVITDIEGNQVPIVQVEGENIPVMDFLSMFKEDFMHIWKTPSAEKAYDNYIAALEILEGEDAVFRIRNAILAERERLNTEIELVTSI